MNPDAEIRKKDLRNLILTLDGREFQINIWDIRRVISEGQKAAQVKEIKALNPNQAVLGVC